MAITRRQFITRTGLATAGTLFGPSLFGHPLVREAMAAIANGRYLITLFLDGGNDGLNTVVPVANGTTGTLRAAYENARRSGDGGLRLTAGDLAQTGIGPDHRTGTALALHPGLRGYQGANGTNAGDGGLKALYDAGEVAVVQGCGYPEYSLSHDDARAIWKTANPLAVATPLGVGWEGRSLNASGYGSTEAPAVVISDFVPLEFSGAVSGVLAIRRLQSFTIPYDEDYPQDRNARKAAFNTLFQLAEAPTQTQPTLQYIGSSGSATLAATDAYPPLHGQYTSARAAFNNLYGSIPSGMGRDFREIAKIVYGVERGVANVGAHFFQLANGGYDTHSDQGAAEPEGQHYQLHAEVSASIKVFRDDLRDMGQALHGDPNAIWGRTAIVVWSEFSRRVEQNDNGTDHGSQGPMFVVGGGVNGGVYGNHPNVNESAWDNSGNTVYHLTGDDHDSTDLRDVYGTVLRHWVGLPAGTVQSLLPLDTVPSGGNATRYWTSADFDLERPADGAPLFKP
jgi:uncharacterized protein (DUF1501 family)